jgi:hypothetical protein
MYMSMAQDLAFRKYFVFLVMLLEVLMKVMMPGWQSDSEHLPSKHKAPSSNSSTEEREKGKEGGREKMRMLLAMRYPEI